MKITDALLTCGILAALALTLPSCGTDRPVVKTKPPAVAAHKPVKREAAGSWADSVLATMTVEQKIGQMIMVSAPAVFVNDSSMEIQRLGSLIRDYGVGGVAVLHGTVYGAAAMVNRLQSMARVPLLIAADLEHGLAMRYARGTDFPDAMAIGATGDPELAYEVGKITAEEGRSVGITVNFAPVADVNTNPQNPVINTRSFGGDPRLVSRMVAAFVRGTLDGGMLPTVKHFPGHGSTSEDSHVILPIVGRTRDALENYDLAPFRAALESGESAVMVGHLAVPAIDSSGLPATLSHKLTAGLLRDALNFNGLIITDAMSMAGARVVPPERAAVMAVQAGSDILLLTTDEYVVIRSLRDAVNSGELSIVRINSSVRRILLAKERLGLDRESRVSVDDAGSVVATPSHWAIARTVARNAVTLLKNQGDILPLHSADQRILSLVLTDREDSRSEVERQESFAFDEPTGAYFTQMLRRSFSVETLRLSSSSSPDDIEKALSAVRRSSITIISTFFGVFSSSGTVGVPSRLDPVVRRLNEATTPIILVTFGDPWVVNAWTSPRAVICAYSDAEPMAQAVAACITGDAPFRGRLPVAISPEYPLNFGIVQGGAWGSRDDTVTTAIRSKGFSSVDSLMNAGVLDSVFPGGQLVVMKSDTVVFHKCYGRFTYDPRSPAVDDSTMYDLASLTKVIATTTSVMRLSDRGMIDLDAPVSRYLLQFRDGEKHRISVRDLLLHRSGFPPFRPLWTLAPTPTAALDTVFATPLVAAPGDSTIYSDFNMITLGAIVERLTRMPLDQYAKSAIFRPLEMHLTCFNPPPALRWHAAPTEYDSVWRKRLVQGNVHDENAAFLGGVSGHAGLFSTASDLSRFALMMLDRGRAYGQEIFSYGTYNRFLGVSSNSGDRWLGWDRRSPEGSSAGSLFSSSSFGHTGFTGTSLWIDPLNRVAIILLTNRVYPTRANLRLSRFRPLLHDAVMRALQE